MAAASRLIVVARTARRRPCHRPPARWVASAASATGAGAGAAPPAPPPPPPPPSPPEGGGGGGTPIAIDTAGLFGRRRPATPLRPRGAGRGDGGGGGGFGGGGLGSGVLLPAAGGPQLSPPPLSGTPTATATSPTPPPTPLSTHLARLIRHTGPLTVAAYMSECLLHPTHGYYTGGGAIFGPAGDFVTAPEVSQVMGECMAVAVAAAVRRGGSDGGGRSGGGGAGLRIVEVGPGRGTLAADLTRGLAALGVRLRGVALVEPSAGLAAAQRRTLAHLPAAGVPTAWYGSLAAVPPATDADGGTVYVAHELLDALPVHQFVWSPAGGRGGGGGGRSAAGGAWRERLVGVDDPADAATPGSGASGLRFVLAAGETPATAAWRTAGPGATADAAAAAAATPAAAGTAAAAAAEWSPAVAATGAELAARVAAEAGSAALVVDYGHDPAVPGGDPRGRAGGWTARALRRHAPEGLLASPGAADVTADVHFGHLRSAVAAAAAEAAAGRARGGASGGAGGGGVVRVPPASVTQGAWLAATGAKERFEALGRAVVAAGGARRGGGGGAAEVDRRLAALQAQYVRLVGGGDVGGMGGVYRVYGWAHESLGGGGLLGVEGD